MTPYLIAFIIVAITYVLYKWTKKDTDKNVENVSESVGENVESVESDAVKRNDVEEGDEKIHILYGSQKGNAKRFAEEMQALTMEKVGVTSFVCPLDEYDPDMFTDSEAYVVIIVSTYTDGSAPENAQKFFYWLEDAKRDQRVPRNLFAGLKFAVFGCGNVEYKSNFNYVGRKVHRYMRNLKGKSLVPLGIGNEQEDMDLQFQNWLRGLWRALKKEYEDELLVQQGLQDKENDYAYHDDSTSSDDGSDDGVTDVEDLANAMVNVDYSTIPLDDLTQEMVTPKVRKSLTKQGYKILGSHSGVKLCRWTKAMLRGRGGCYKHTFYGITSYQCMEMTPSLACANKCVFCWRHHSNPVGTQWKWKVDDPEFLVDEAIKNHFSMINTMKGVPGVRQERLLEGTTKVRHCALSLVGEPIIYPYINEFINLLHDREISTFFVTNAQFPDQMETLRPVTQLYVSIDAATPETLKEIDRPLFSDFWERYIASIDSLARKGQRTVFRLTLVKEYNMEDLESYAKLIIRGHPDFIEIKGVTYCGKSEASNLNITNTPFHQEVINFSNALNEQIEKWSDNELSYGLSCEHEHSLCILLGNTKKFLIDGQWHTWINYPKFHELVNGTKPFSSVDYMEITPPWAVYGSTERGFDPNETRFRRNKKKPPTGGC